MFGGSGGESTGFADADGNMAEDHHTISGYAFILHGSAILWSAKCQEIISLFFPLLRASMSLLPMLPKKPCGCVPLSHSFSQLTLTPPLFSWTINLPLHSLKIVSIMHRPSILTFDSISSVGSSKKALFSLFTALPMTW
jgi:hypothetical protein